jgi:hypothetical protein
MFETRLHTYRADADAADIVFFPNFFRFVQCAGEELFRAAWVEKGAAPGAFVGSQVERGETVRARPLCAYPAVANYKGTGDKGKAENFTCAGP